MCDSTYNSNIVIKVEKFVDMTPKSPTCDDSVIIVSPTLIDKPLKSQFSCGDLNTVYSVFE